MCERTADFEERYDIISTAAWILGHARNTGTPVLPVTIRHKRAFDCSAEQLEHEQLKLSTVSVPVEDLFLH